MKKTLGLACVWLALAVPAYPAAPVTEPGARNQALHQAIRKGDATRMKQLLEQGADPNATDEKGTPALMNAVLYMNADAVRVLVRRGARVNNKNGAGATALLWAAGDPAKARILLDAGADGNVQSGPGRTALMTAAAAPGSAMTVKMLLDKGAAVDVKDRIDGIPVIPTGGGRGTALIDAARLGDPASIEALLAAGADVNATDSHNGSPLSEAVLYGRQDIVKTLLAKGAKVDATVTPLKMPLLTLAAMRRDAAMIRTLVEAGAPVNTADVTGATPLMWAAYGDANNEAAVDALLEAKADPMARNKAGESALDWAMARGETAVTKKLRQIGAPSRTAAQTKDVRGAGVNVPLEKTMAMLLPSKETLRSGGCATCHNHTLPLVAAAAASRKGVAVNAESVDMMMKQLMGMMMPAAEVLAEGSDAVPDMTIAGGYFVEAMAAQNMPANDLTASIVHSLLLKQTPEGRWVGWAPRPPLESGDVQATAMSIRSLTLYPIPGRKAEIDERVRRAAAWLAKIQPATGEERIMKLLGLHWAGAPAAQVKEAARQLVSAQREDGGWAQLDRLDADAYATGKAIYALAQLRGSKNLPATAGPATRKGVEFLKQTRQADGTWHVKTRAFPFQPLKDSGFPHGRDQWISAAATSWAVMALLEAEGAPTTQAKPVSKTRRFAD